MTGTRDATAADLPEIDRLYREEFGATFGHLYSDGDFAAFMARFTPEAWAAEFNDPRYAFHLAEADGRIIGYCKIGPMDLPVENCGEGARELYQIYLGAAAKGKGVADALMGWAYDQARKLGGDTLYLSVFTDNHRARRFYERHGFVEVGPYEFMVGDHVDADIIMKRAI